MRTLGGVVTVLPIIVLLFIIGLMGRGGTGMLVLLPIVIMVGAGAVVVSMVLHEGRPKRNPSVRQLPTDHLRRQMFLALRPNRGKRKQERGKPEE
jgi:hypothetical protein